MIITNLYYILSILLMVTYLEEMLVNCRTNPC